MMAESPAQKAARKLRETEDRIERNLAALVRLNTGAAIEACCNVSESDWSICGHRKDVDTAIEYLAKIEAFELVRIHHDQELGESFAYLREI